MGFDTKVQVQLQQQASTRALYPISPEKITRYARKAGSRAEPRCITVKPGILRHKLSNECTYTPTGWSEHVQAEGQLYFHEANRHFVTEANIRKPEVFRLVSQWMLCIEKKAEAMQIPITESIEIMVQLDQEDEGACGYYMVDHACGSIFWLDEVSSEKLNIHPPPVSESNLQWAFTELYWLHVEYFSPHLVGIRMSLARELISILTQVRADHLTSAVGTFSYSAEQCKNFIELLRDHVSSSELITDSYIIWIIARLWSQVARNRYLNHYGEEIARLSRDQYVTKNKPADGTFAVRMLSKTILLNLPSNYAKELNLLWVDNTVYVEPCKAFSAKMLGEWNIWATWLFAFSLIHGFFYFMPAIPHAVSIGSLTLTLIGFVASIFLVNYHRPSNASEIIDDAAAYLENLYCPEHGFALLACAFSVPKAILYWSALLAISEALVSAVVVSNYTLGYGAVGLLVVLSIFGASVLSVILSRFSKDNSNLDKAPCSLPIEDGRV